MFGAKANYRPFSSMAFWALSPVCAVQGLQLRRRAVRLRPPAGDTAGCVGQGSDIHLLAAGDSIIAGIGAGEREETLPVQFARALAFRLGRRVCWRSEGENGADIRHLLRRMASLGSDVTADVILLSVGVNDVTGLSTTRRWCHQLMLLAKTIRSRWPLALVVFTGLPPMNQFPLLRQPLRFALGLRARVFDGIAEQVIKRQPRMLHAPTVVSSRLSDFCADGFHPSTNAYAVWADRLAQRVAAETSHFQQGESQS